MTAGTLIDGGFTISVTKAGGWMKNGGTFTATGSVDMNSGADQTIGGTQTTAFNNLNMNNSGAIGVTFGASISVSNILTLNSGLIYSSAANLLNMLTGSSVTGASDNSYVAGPMTKTGTTDFTFPVGKDGEYRLIAVSSLSASATFQAEYIHSSAGVLYALSNKVAAIDHIGNCEYWNLTRTAGAGNAKVTLSWDDYSCGVTNLSTLLVARWGTPTWQNHGNGGTTGTTVSGTIVTPAVLTVFGAFNLSSSSVEDNPLPISLIDFTAKPDRDIVVLNWATGAEIDNDRFEVMRSSDGTDYSLLGTVSAVGNSSTTTRYFFNDESPKEGYNYYKLGQVDFNGTQTVTDPKLVLINPSFVTNKDVVVTPLYNHGHIQIRFMTDEDLTWTIRVINIAGQTIFSGQLTGGSSVDHFVPMNNSSHGVYVVVVGNQEQEYCTKLIY